ncbi:MAG TPA: hypothetical protein VM261_11840 [Kofleriaceae bacterium]|nr:hypothetical protein [Kofleriaceae bacterium]
MTRTIRVALLLALLLGAACKKSAPGPQEPVPAGGSGSASAAAPVDPTPASSTVSDAEFDQIMHDVIAYMTALGNAAAGAKGNCPEMAAAIERVIGEHSDLTTRASQLDTDPTAEDRAEAWMKANDATARPAFDKLFAEVQKCEEDAAVQAAVAKIGSM